MTNPPYPLVPVPQPPSWLERHSGWKIPLGCLVLMVLLGGFVAGLLTFIVTSFHRSDVYQQSLARAREDPRVRQQLGQPIQPAWFISGQLSVSGSSGKADLSIPISGPKGKATIRAVASKNAGEWRFSWLQVVVEGQEPIDLLSTPDGNSPTPETGNSAR